MAWQQFLRYDPLPQFEGVADDALQYQVTRDLYMKNPGLASRLWTIPAVIRILKKQQEDGSWRYPKRKTDPREISGYRQLETFRQLGVLVEKYLLNREHPSIQSAAEFFFRCQTEEGDFRGIYLDQYSPNYTAAFLEILIKAGYFNEETIKRSLEWLLSIRQDDGGWVVPLRTEHLRWSEVKRLTEPIQPQRDKPFSHMITGVVLRAFAAHPKYNRYPDIIRSGEKLASRMFKADSYTDRKAPEYWTKITFPFWFTDILSTLDTLSKLGLPADNPNIKEAIDWIAEQQKKDGSWSFHLLRSGGEKNYNQWVALAICRMLQRFVQ
ncbi:hypothetical protein EU527_06705 [Candidatus Thorarchaeota archaeon]|nr:MAG: hypothetical protein EU527_06705 [Candidatus Thorarchaeota archaeon]